MKPWIGEEYTAHRIMVVCESHYMPEGSDVNLDPDRWYAAHECELAACERSYINTVGCVEYRLSPEGRVKLPNNAYVRINDVVSFDRIVFANYFYRPARYKSNIASVGISRKDTVVAADIMRWLVGLHKPRLVMVASKTTVGRHASPVLDELQVEYCVVYHPMARKQGEFRRQARECLNSITDR